MKRHIRDVLMRHRVSLVEAATIIAVIFTAAMLALLFTPLTAAPESAARESIP